MIIHLVFIDNGLEYDDRRVYLLNAYSNKRLANREGSKHIEKFTQDLYHSKGFYFIQSLKVDSNRRKLINL